MINKSAASIFQKLQIFMHWHLYLFSCSPSIPFKTTNLNLTLLHKCIWFDKNFWSNCHKHKLALKKTKFCIENVLILIWILRFLSTFNILSLDWNFKNGYLSGTSTALHSLLSDLQEVHMSSLSEHSQSAASTHQLSGGLAAASYEITRFSTSTLCTTIRNSSRM